VTSDRLERVVMPRRESLFQKSFPASHGPFAFQSLNRLKKSMTCKSVGGLTREVLHGQRLSSLSRGRANEKKGSEVLSSPAGDRYCRAES